MKNHQAKNPIVTGINCKYSFETAIATSTAPFEVIDLNLCFRGEFLQNVFIREPIEV